MDQLIPVINKLQDVFNTVGLDSFELPLPQIAVVGSQSSGKSSVLETLVGRDFLPRGTGIVTRRPLVLQMVYVPARPNARDAPTEWGEFLHKPGEKFYDFDKIREEIVRDTDRETGGEEGKAISNKPINLKIYSPNVLNLTLVDLPGITKVPVGAQPDNIEEQINELIMHYIMQPQCIILAVTAANTDMANSDALKMARKVDPHGERTIGVVTKLDLMDRGTDAMDVLTGKIVPLRLGYIGVVNRGQQAINTKVSIAAARDAEAEFFSSHPAYSSIKARLGTAYLAKSLNKILMRHIQATLPELRGRVKSMLLAAQSKMASFGDPLLDSVDKAGLILHLMTKFASTYIAIIDGTAGSLTTSELSGGARISYIFHDIFGRTLDEASSLEGLTIYDIKTAIRNASGVKPALFIPDACFELLVKRQIQLLQDPSQRCVELVYEELLRILHQCESPELGRFEGLWGSISSTVEGMVRARLEPTSRMVADIISMELAYINTNHPDFIGVANALSELQEQRVEDSVLVQPDNSTTHDLPSSVNTQQEEMIPMEDIQQMMGAMGMSKEQRTLTPQAAGGRSGLAPPRAGNESHSMTDLDAYRDNPRRQQADHRMQMEANLLQEIELIQRLLDSYFNIVRKRVQDSVPKAIMLHMVNAVKEHLQSTLVAKLYTPESVETLLQESPHIAKQRKETKEVLDTLNRAASILNTISDSVQL
eukprot:comp21132_c0_seq2/m.28575 comp21132_c0_seq2/g.28575  ORF comp21132_c0_seq2/g.28575 comp21132_c0_seq2/m.28575 type:complete len:709 (-) comp21132_c0_seq2:634-2760(-)